jgi:hypothetical protein
MAGAPLAIVSNRLEGLLGLELDGAFSLPESTEANVGGSLAFVSGTGGGSPALELVGFGFAESEEGKVGGSLAFLSGPGEGLLASDPKRDFVLGESNEGNADGSLGFVSGSGGGPPATELDGVFSLPGSTGGNVGGFLAFVSGKGGAAPALEPDSDFSLGVSEEGKAGESCALLLSSEIVGRPGPSPRLLGSGRLGSSLSSAAIGLSFFFRCCAINPSYEAVRTRLFVPRSTRLADGLKRIPREQDLTQGRA